MKKFSFIYLFLLSFSTQVKAILDISITEGMDSASPIAIIPFEWTGSPLLADADISKIVKLDLARSGRFSPIPETDLIDKPTKPEDVHFGSWRVVGIDHVVIGAVEALGNDQFNVKFRLFDVFKEEQVLGYSIPATRASLRSVAHRISDPDRCGLGWRPRLCDVERREQ